MGNSVTDGVVQGVFREGFTLEAVVAIAVYQGLAMRTMGGCCRSKERKAKFPSQAKREDLIG